ncbi:hypothetical protein [Pelagibacterium lacus]|uniref:hypothetical protein n=1 Tax=Pelagibacterium lacus TaxID=2282655 RepID=UPI0011C07DE2|nr:hypothetical protein [Pelagibacterium lacus]
MQLDLGDRGHGISAGRKDVIASIEIVGRDILALHRCGRVGIERERGLSIGNSGPLVMGDARTQILKGDPQFTDEMADRIDDLIDWGEHDLPLCPGLDGGKDQRGKSALIRLADFGDQKLSPSVVVVV